jgi:hypothetical protein
MRDDQDSQLLSSVPIRMGVLAPGERQDPAVEMCRLLPRMDGNHLPADVHEMSAQRINYSSAGCPERRHFGVSINENRLDESRQLVQSEKPEITRSEVAELVCADWGVRRQLRLVETEPLDRLADRVLMMTRRRT